MVHLAAGSIIAVVEPASGKYLELTGSTYTYNSDLGSFVAELDARFAAQDAILIWFAQTFGTVPPGAETALALAVRRYPR